jgi:hypothetical protein
MQALHSKLFRVGEPHNLFLLDYENKNVIYIKKKTQERAVVSQTKSKKKQKKTNNGEKEEDMLI